jgi:hypothetical protein
VFTVRTPLTADDSLAAIRARSKFGIAMAAIIKMIATTISNSISEKPFCFRISVVSSSPIGLDKSKPATDIALYGPQRKVTEITIFARLNLAFSSSPGTIVTAPLSFP